jgi:type IV secretory pathway protease TraF
VLLAAALVGLRHLDAPLILYPTSASLPEGLYFQTFGDIEIGKIAAFPVPEAARHYQSQRGDPSPKDFLFMKPVVAGPGDQVCNSAAGLFLNGKRWVAAASHDVLVNSPPVWRGCRPLNSDEFFMLSDYAPNSFDSRYFGPIRADDIVGVYSATF